MFMNRTTEILLGLKANLKIGVKKYVVRNVYAARHCKKTSSAAVVYPEAPIDR